jgi:hypothetical protein
MSSLARISPPPSTHGATARRRSRKAHWARLNSRSSRTPERSTRGPYAGECHRTMTRFSRRGSQRKRSHDSAVAIERSTPQRWKCGESADHRQECSEDETTSGDNRGAEVAVFYGLGVGFLQDAFDPAFPWCEARDHGSAAWSGHALAGARRSGVCLDRRMRAVGWKTPDLRCAQRTGKHDARRKYQERRSAANHSQAPSFSLCSASLR